MPTNLPPEYFEVDARYRSASTTAEKISALEELISTIPKHKGTEKLRAGLRRRLSKLRSDEQKQSKGSRHESHYHIEKEGAARVVVVGPPNVGKSSLVATLTHATPKISEYPHTTWMPIPGMMPIDNVPVQLIDTPPMSQEHTEPDLIGLIKSADMGLLVLDLQADPLQQFEDSLAILKQNRITPHYFEVETEHPRMDHIPFLIIVNKDDSEGLDEDFDILCELLHERELTLISISAKTGRNLDNMKQVIFEKLKLIRVYSKPPGKEADLGSPFVLKQGSTIADFAGRVHKDFKDFKTARIWGRGVHDGQRVGRAHEIHDGDVVELHL